MQACHSYAGDMSMPGSAYFQYMARQRDDSPLYLFDKAFLEKVPDLAADFAVPPPFPEDLFALLDGQPCRPDHRCVKSHSNLRAILALGLGSSSVTWQRLWEHGSNRMHVILAINQRNQTDSLPCFEGIEQTCCLKVEKANRLLAVPFEGARDRRWHWWSAGDDCLGMFRCDSE
jgi:hypothetical protein